MNKNWSEAEKNYIRENYVEETDESLASNLTKMTGKLRKMEAVKKQRQRMNLIKKSGRKRRDA